ncbi:MAG: hypothetical protein DMF49_08890 [Acidobacteria bacterium]|nr:MAG: hypothetical protein DMF49_08890 [Acidobacteriota bacterium]
MRLLFFVSDHGFGHAARTIALLREALVQEPALEVRLVSGPNAGEFLARSFLGEARVRVLIRPSDPGLILFPATLRIDSAATSRAWRAWAGCWADWAREETREADRWGRPDAVLADGTPPAFLVAESLGLPGLLLGNFAWSDLLSWHVTEEVLSQVRQALSRASASFAYPFRLGFDGAPAPRPLPLVARRPGRSRAEVRHVLGVGEEEPLIYLSSGQSSSPDDLWQLAESAGSRLLVPSNAPEIAGALRIPGGDTEGQDYIGASDLIVGKVGYGTLSEALVCGVPMVMLLLDRTPETAPLAAGMREAGAGETCAAGEQAAPAVRRWLGQGGGATRPYSKEDSTGAARLLLDEIRRLVAD